MSINEVQDLRARIEDVDRRLIRIEERQVTLYRMIETSLSNFGDLANRVTSLEHLRTKLLVVAGFIGAGMSLAWDFLKSRFGGN
jgi:hypothetical protein